MICLGIDTSNYTTSAALYNTQTNEVYHKRRLLSVKQGELGLRQSDAVFQHTVQLPQIINELYESCPQTPNVIAASVSPRDETGSYMPCFMCGKGAADILGKVMGVSVKYFSHQCGHIAAALYSADRLNMLNSSFIAFHVSGGTTEAVLVVPDSKKIIKVSMLAASSDLKAGQCIDRVGSMLGLNFPSGQALDELSRKSTASFNIKPFIKDGSCSFSGLQNKCEQMFNNGAAPEDTAKYCIDYISAALSAMTQQLLLKYPNMPFLYSGGVMSNSLIRERFTKEYGGVFAQNGFSSDNAAGVAVLGALSSQ